MGWAVVAVLGFLALVVVVVVLAAPGTARWERDRRASVVPRPQPQQAPVRRVRGLDRLRTRLAVVAGRLPRAAVQSRGLTDIVRTTGSVTRRGVAALGRRLGRRRPSGRRVPSPSSGPGPAEPTGPVPSPRRARRVPGSGTRARLAARIAAGVHRHVHEDADGQT